MAPPHEERPMLRISMTIAILFALAACHASGGIGIH
jgi:hypothetical protein